LEFLDHTGEEMSKRYNTYTIEFKKDAVELANEIVFQSRSQQSLLNNAADCGLDSSPARRIRKGLPSSKI